MEVEWLLRDAEEVLMEFHQLRRLPDGLAADLAGHGEVGDLVAVLHGTVFQLELLVEDVDVTIAMEFHKEDVLVKVDVMSDNAVSLLEADGKVDEGGLDVDALTVAHFTRNPVDGNGFLRKCDVSGQLDDVVEHVDDLLLFGVKKEATELDDVRPSGGEFFDWRRGCVAGCPGRKSGGFGVENENEHGCLVWQAVKYLWRENIKRISIFSNECLWLIVVI